MMVSCGMPPAGIGKRVALPETLTRSGKSSIDELKS
jgi:hypothetical protein